MVFLLRSAVQWFFIPPFAPSLFIFFGKVSTSFFYTDGEFRECSCLFPAAVGACFAFIGLNCVHPLTWSSCQFAYFEDGEVRRSGCRITRGDNLNKYNWGKKSPRMSLVRIYTCLQRVRFVSGLAAPELRQEGAAVWMQMCVCVCVSLWHITWNVNYSCVWFFFFSLYADCLQLQCACLFCLFVWLKNCNSSYFLFVCQSSATAAKDSRGALGGVGLSGLSPDWPDLWQLPRGTSRRPGHVLRSVWVKGLRVRPLPKPGLNFFRGKKKILDRSSSRRICKNLSVSFPPCYFHTDFPYALKQTDIRIAAWSALCFFRGRRLTLNKPLHPPPPPPSTS